MEARTLLLAFVKVDGLGAMDGNSREAAGDEARRAVAGALVAFLRSDELVVRFGDDHFVLAMPRLDLARASGRLEELLRVLDALRPVTTVSAVLSVAGPRDTAASVLARGHDDLCALSRACSRGLPGVIAGSGVGTGDHR